ncbi:MAG: YbhB/YbcL family Raf kinase inhibitor-like protein [Pseudomonadota bacterium]
MVALLIGMVLSTPVPAQDAFVLSSPVLTDGGRWPAGLKCARDGGDGLSPPLDWRGLPAGTRSLALAMQHCLRGMIQGVDAPSQYWLLWNVPADVTALSRGNPESIGDEGSDKDGRRIGYTPPCFPGAEPHIYTITLHALAAPSDGLPDHDAREIDWTAMMTAIDGLIIASTSFSFMN